MLDKNNTLSNLGTLKCVELELGCGGKKLKNDSIGIDLIDYDCVDIVGDIFKVLAAFPDETVDKIVAHHFIEHIDNLSDLITEFNRVVKNGGTIEILVPHFSNPFFYSDPTHRNFFGLYTFQYYFNSESIFKRKVPNYNSKLKMEVISVDLFFKSYKPNYLRHGFKKLFQLFFNFNTTTKEMYEELFCYIIPCYEVKYIILNRR